MVTVSKIIFFFCWLAHCGGFDPCSMVKSDGAKELAEPNPPGFRLNVFHLRGVGRVRGEFVFSPFMIVRNTSLSGVIKGRC